MHGWKICFAAWSVRSWLKIEEKSHYSIDNQKLKNVRG
jgi:hypothetical protein